MIRFLVIIIMSLCALSKAHGEEEKIDLGYDRNIRITYISEALNLYSKLSERDMNAYEERVNLANKTNCRTSKVELKAQCLVNETKAFCEGKKNDKSCMKILDLLISSQMGQKDFISPREQIKILQQSDDRKNAIKEELWSRYASLATDFRISDKISCLDSKKDCFAASIERFCRYKADFGEQTWQSCVSALIKFVAKPSQSIVSAKKKEETEEVAKEEKYQGTFIVKFESEEESHLWVAKAMEQTTYHILSGFERLKPVEAPQEFNDSCYLQECQMQWLKENKIDVFLKGRVVYDKLIVEAFDIYDQQKINETTYPIVAGNDLSSFKIRMFQLVRPFTKHGGLIDRIEARRNMMFLEADLLMTPQDLIAYLGIENPHLINLIEVLFKAYPLLGGILWGLFIVYLFKFCFPKIYKFENVVTRVMPSLLKAWFIISSWRSCIFFLAFFPLILILSGAKIYWHLPELFFWSFLTPFTLCIGMIFWIIILESSIFMRDKKIAIGEANKNNIYHKAITNYLNDYLNRNDKRMAPRLINNALFLAQKGNTIETYGGVLTKARIVIDIRLIELALGEVDEQDDQEEEKPKDEVAVVFEEEEKEEDDPDKPEDLRVKSDKKLRSKYMKLETFKNLSSFKQFEVNAKGEKGLAIHDDELPPEKVIDDEDDIDPDFIRKLDLKTEDYRDFLYGLLLSELASVYTKHSVFRLVTDYSSKSSEKLPKFLMRFRKFIQRTYQRNYSRYPQIINDSLVPSFKGIPHMFQFLSYRMTGDKDLLTQNASKKELWELSHDILSAIRSDEDNEEDAYFNNATWKNRIIWLSHHLYPKKKVKRKYSMSVKFMQSMLVIAVVSFVIFKFWESYEYSNTYELRIEEQMKKIEEAKKKREAHQQQAPEKKSEVSPADQ